MVIRCKIENLDAVIGEILTEYADDVNKGLQAAVPKVAKITQQEVKAASPVSKYTEYKGRYKKGWTATEMTINRMEADYVIHNRTDGQLTHLLEKGHVLKRGGRRVGTVPAQVHIAPAEEHAIKMMEEAVEKIAKGASS